MSSAESEWWRGAVVYQVYPRSFADSNGDGVGDLPGVLSRLDHVAGLGVDAIWLSPFFPSPMHDSGYDVSDFRDVDPVFGTLADFDRLLAAAHSRGLKVIIDQVYSHSSCQHHWFAESRARRHGPKSDWYVWADPKPDGAPPNNWQSLFGGPAWTWDGRRRQYYLHNFLKQQPDLNLHNPEVQEAILDIARFWLERGVDGFRLDAANFYLHDPQLRDNPPSARKDAACPYDFQRHLYNRRHKGSLRFAARLRCLLEGYEDRVAVAEIGDCDAEREVVDFATGRDCCHSAYGFAFFRAPALSPSVLRAALAPWQKAKEDAWPSWTFSNHDAPRVVSRWARSPEEEADPRFAVLLNILLCCLRGTVLLYQGQELGLPQADIPFERLRDPEALANWPHTLGRDGARTPMPWTADAPHAGFSAAPPWLPVDPAHIPRAVDRQAADHASPLEQLRAFLKLRRTLPALRLGHLGFLPAKKPLLAFERVHAGERLVCLFNLAGVPAVWPGIAPGPVLAGSEGLSGTGEVRLPAYGWAIWRG